MKRRFEGVFPVVPTVFHADGTLDLPGQLRCVDFMIDAGSNGLCILANFSEQFALADDERDLLTRTILEHVAARVPVIVTTTHFSSAVCAARSRRAQELGAAMVMVMPPYHGATLRVGEGEVAALEDRCCHRELPLSMGTVESCGVRCGYHGLLFNAAGACIEIPGQERIPAKARVTAFPLRERDQILWIWFGATPDSQPQCEPPAYTVHTDPRYKFGGDVFHYDAPWQLIHDNLLDLSHLGYVHLKTIGGNAKVHMNAQLKVEQQGDVVRVVRLMPESDPPPTYTAAWPFTGLIDRWQEVEFHTSHLLIWTGAMDVGSGDLTDPAREGFHMRGFHGITPETDTSSHYFWTIATNPHPERQDVTKLVVEQTAATFEEDKVVIEAQYRNQCRFGPQQVVDIHVDVGPNRARRVVQAQIKRQPA